MAGGRAVPALDAQALIAAVPDLGDVPDLEARQVRQLPGSQMGLDDAMAVAGEAAAVARSGRGVVVTHGTDTLEETAVLCACLHDADAPVVFTGAIRPSSTHGADGPANLSDAVAAAAFTPIGGHVLVCFGGELHSAYDVRKVHSTSPMAFGSPRSGPLGFVNEGRVDWRRTPATGPAFAVDALRSRVDIVPTWLGDDGSLLRAAAREADGIVLVTLGAGHVPPPVLAAMRELDVPLVAVVRPERGAVVHGTYGFEGAEGDVRAAAWACAGSLSPQAARMVLLTVLAAGCDRGGVRAAFEPFDG